MGGTGYALVASRQVIDVDVCLCERDSVYRIVNPLKGCYNVSSLCVCKRDTDGDYHVYLLATF